MFIGRNTQFDFGKYRRVHVKDILQGGPSLIKQFLNYLEWLQDETDHEVCDKLLDIVYKLDNKRANKKRKGFYEASIIDTN